MYDRGNGVTSVGNSASSSGGTNPLLIMAGNAASKVGETLYGTNDSLNNLDVTGTSQAQWDLDKTKELLEEQRAYNSAEAQKSREWQEMMSNTAYQRAVQDLEDAGLNKWLAVTGQANGASASTPSGATASSSSGDASTPSPVLLKALIQSLGNFLSSASRLFGK